MIVYVFLRTAILYVVVRIDNVRFLFLLAEDACSEGRADEALTDQASTRGADENDSIDQQR